MWRLRHTENREGEVALLLIFLVFLYRMWIQRLKVLSVLLEGNWTWVLLHPGSIEIRISFCLWHFSLLYRWLSCHWACTNQERRWLWDLMNNIKVHLLIWAELDLNDGIYIMADDNRNCGILTLEIFFSYVYGKTKRLCWMKLYKETIWNVLLSESCMSCALVSFPLFTFYFFFFFSFSLYMTPVFYFLHHNRNVFGTMLLNP